MDEFSVLDEVREGVWVQVGSRRSYVNACELIQVHGDAPFYISG